MKVKRISALKGDFRYFFEESKRLELFLCELICFDLTVQTSFQVVESIILYRGDDDVSSHLRSMEF